MKYKKFMSILLLQLFIFMLFGFTKVSAAGREAFNIVTNPGEDMSTSVRVNWHSDIEDSFLEYTTVDDVEYNNKIVIEPDVRSFSKPANEGGYVSNGFSKRYVCTAVIDNLEPGTEYMYRIGKTNFSDNYYFKTASDKDFTFVHITDPQYADAAGAEVFNTLLGLAYEQDIAFSFFTGDVVDRGGIEEQWSIFFTRSNINKGVIATGVGNHEYYDASSSPKHYNNGWYNGFHNNPKNGPEEVLNSTYYFTYNNALFIMIDSETKVIEPQKEWFAQVCEEHFDKDFIIVGMHRSMYGSIYASDSVAVRRNWQPLFDKYGVDLVLSGHDHIYARSHSIYKNQISKDPIYGTTYIIGGSGGKKYYQANKDPMYAKTITHTSVANLITITKDEISLKLIGTAGGVLDEHVISKKRVGEVDSSFNKETFKQGITIEQDNNKTGGTLIWPENFYGNVVQMSIHRSDSTLKTELYLYNKNQTQLRFSGINPTGPSTFIVEVTYLDGTVDEVEFEIDNTVPYYPTIHEVLEMIRESFNSSVAKIFGKDE